MLKGGKERGMREREREEEVGERAHTHTLVYARACDFSSSFIKMVPYSRIHFVSSKSLRIVTISYFGTRLLAWRRSLDKHVLIYTRAYVSNTRANPHTDPSRSPPLSLIFSFSSYSFFLHRPSQFFLGVS